MQKFICFWGLLIWYALQISASATNAQLPAVAFSKKWKTEFQQTVQLKRQLQQLTTTYDGTDESLAAIRQQAELLAAAAPNCMYAVEAVVYTLPTETLRDGLDNYLTKTQDTNAALIAMTESNAFESAEYAEHTLLQRSTFLELLQQNSFDELQHRYIDKGFNVNTVKDTPTDRRFLTIGNQEDFLLKNGYNPRLFMGIRTLQKKILWHFGRRKKTKNKSTLLLAESSLVPQMDIETQDPDLAQWRFDMLSRTPTYKKHKAEKSRVQERFVKRHPYMAAIATSGKIIISLIVGYKIIMHLLPKTPPTS